MTITRALFVFFILWVATNVMVLADEANRPNQSNQPTHTPPRFLLRTFQFLTGEQAQQEDVADQPATLEAVPKLFSAPMMAAKAARPKKTKVQAENSAHTQAFLAEIEQFLVNVGFEHFSENMLAALESNQNEDGEKLSAIEKAVLRRNAEMYRVFDLARGLGSILALQLEEGGKRDGTQRSEEFRKEFVMFAARLIAYQPTKLDLSEGNLPYWVLNEPDEKIKNEGFLKQVSGVATLAARLDLDVLTSDLITSIFQNKKLKSVLDETVKTQVISEEHQGYAAVITEFVNLLTEYVRFSYLNNEMGQTRYLGRAVAAIIQRFSLVHDDPELFEMLKTEVAERHGLELGNFIGDELSFSKTVATKKGKKRTITEKVTLKEGAFIFEKSGKTAESIAITGGVIPSDPGDRKRAKERGLLGSLATLGLVVGANEDNPTTIDKLRQKILDKLGPLNGFSHVGRVVLRRVSINTSQGPKDVVVPWVADIYPGTSKVDGDIGGIRLIGVETFALIPGQYDSLGFADYDPVKFFEYYKNSIYPENGIVWTYKNHRVRSDDGDGFDVKSLKKPQYVKTILTPDQFEQMKRLRSGETKAQWYRRLQKGVDDHILKTMISRRGTPFDYSFLGAGPYCSLFDNLAFLEALGVDIEVKQSQWHPLAKFGLKFQQVKDIFEPDIAHRIIPPAAPAWSALVSNYAAINLYMPTEREIERLLGKPIWLPINSGVFEALRDFRPYREGAKKLVITPDDVRDGLADEIGLSSGLKHDVFDVQAVKEITVGRHQKRTLGKSAGNAFQAQCRIALSNLNRLR